MRSEERARRCAVKSVRADDEISEDAPGTGIAGLRTPALGIGPIGQGCALPHLPREAPVDVDGGFLEKPLHKCAIAAGGCNQFCVDQGRDYERTLCSCLIQDEAHVVGDLPIVAQDCQNDVGIKSSSHYSPRISRIPATISSMLFPGPSRRAPA